MKTKTEAERYKEYETELAFWRPAFRIPKPSDYGLTNSQVYSFKNNLSIPNSK